MIHQWDEVKAELRDVVLEHARKCALRAGEAATERCFDVAEAWRARRKRFDELAAALAAPGQHEAVWNNRAVVPPREGEGDGDVPRVR